MSKGYKRFTKKELEEAGKRADKSSKGTNREYYKHLFDMFSEMKVYRERANNVFIDEENEKDKGF